MPASVGYLVIDTIDPAPLTPFWCGLLDVEIATTIGDGTFVVLSPTKGGGLTIGFQRVPEAKAGKNRLHLDLIVEDLGKATAEMEALGGGGGGRGTTRELEGVRGRMEGPPPRKKNLIKISPPLIENPPP